MQIAFLGGDRRMTLCAERAKREGHGIFAAVGGEGLLSHEVLTGVRGASLLVLPYPATRDGVHITGTHIPFSVLPLREGATVVGGAIPPDWHREHILFYDVAKEEPFLWQNARLTAEGALAVAMTATERGLFGVDAAVLGFGRIGAQLARLLACLGARVTVYARRPSVRAAAEAEGFETGALSFPAHLPHAVVFNTLPPDVTPCVSLAKGALCYDLGGGLSAALSDGEGGETAVISLRGVPGVYAPLAAATVYYDAVSPFFAGTGASENESFPEDEVVPTFAEGR